MGIARCVLGYRAIPTEFGNSHARIAGISFTRAFNVRFTTNLSRQADAPE
jgi:hypothetical protein